MDMLNAAGCPHAGCGHGPMPMTGKNTNRIWRQNEYGDPQSIPLPNQGMFKNHVLSTKSHTVRRIMI